VSAEDRVVSFLFEGGGFDMSRNFGWYCIAAATALMTFAVTDAQAFGRRNGGSCGSNGGYNSYGSNGSNGSFGGRFHRGRGSWGSNGSHGSNGSNGGYNNGCGSHGGYYNGRGGEVIYGEVQNGESKPVEHEAQYHERSDSTFESREGQRTPDADKPMPAPAEGNRDAGRDAVNQRDVGQAGTEPAASRPTVSQSDQQPVQTEQRSDQSAQDQPSQNQKLGAPQQPPGSSTESGT